MLDTYCINNSLYYTKNLDNFQKALLSATLEGGKHFNLTKIPKLMHIAQARGFLLM